MKHYRSKKKTLNRLILVENSGKCTIVRDNKKGRLFAKKWMENKDI